MFSFAKSTDLLFQNRSILLAGVSESIIPPLENLLKRQGCKIIRTSTTEAVSLIENSSPIDAAILEIDLEKELLCPVARELLKQNIPFLFLSHRSSNSSMPKEFAAIGTIEIPIIEDVFLTELANLLCPGNGPY